MNAAVVVPWVREEERRLFLEAWKVDTIPDWLILQQDSYREGCGITKNKGIREAIMREADVVIILDGDCYPFSDASLSDLVARHLAALEPQPVDLFHIITDPPSRGTPYQQLTVKMPVAASMGYWRRVPDYCAARQLVYQAKEMTFHQRAIHGKYFPLCGMNLAFRPAYWLPWCDFINVDRFDDIWMGWLWQKEAYRRGFCFNLNGPLITHARQSNVWKNLQQEAVHLEVNETLWAEIAMSQETTYDALRKLLPC